MSIQDLHWFPLIYESLKTGQYNKQHNTTTQEVSIMHKITRSPLES